VGIDENREHAERFIVLDKTHPTHIGREIVDVAGALGGFLTVFLEIQIERKILNVVETPIPLIKRLNVYRPDPLVASRAETRDKIPANETTRPGNKD
jgi:hypothetical protein